MAILRSLLVASAVGECRQGGITPMQQPCNYSGFRRNFPVWRSNASKMIVGPHRGHGAPRDHLDASIRQWGMWHQCSTQKAGDVALVHAETAGCGTRAALVLSRADFRARAPLRSAPCSPA